LLSVMVGETASVAVNVTDASGTAVDIPESLTFTSSDSAIQITGDGEISADSLAVATISAAAGDQELLGDLLVVSTSDRAGTSGTGGTSSTGGLPCPNDAPYQVVWCDIGWSPAAFSRPGLEFDPRVAVVRRRVRDDGTECGWH